ncbi:hypothetical protein AAMO2058_001134000 [Amorphochlora amoebiformis]
MMSAWSRLGYQPSYGILSELVGKFVSGVDSAPLTEIFKFIHALQNFGNNRFSPGYYRRLFRRMDMLLPALSPSGEGNGSYVGGVNTTTRIPTHLTASTLANGIWGLARLRVWGLSRYPRLKKKLTVSFVNALQRSNMNLSSASCANSLWASTRLNMSLPHDIALKIAQIVVDDEEAMQARPHIAIHALWGLASYSEGIPLRLLETLDTQITRAMEMSRFSLGMCLEVMEARIKLNTQLPHGQKAALQRALITSLSNQTRLNPFMQTRLPMLLRYAGETLLIGAPWADDGCIEMLKVMNSRIWGDLLDYRSVYALMSMLVTYATHFQPDIRSKTGAESVITRIYSVLRKRVPSSIPREIWLSRLILASKSLNRLEDLLPTLRFIEQEIEQRTYWIPNRTNLTRLREAYSTAGLTFNLTNIKFAPTALGSKKVEDDAMEGAGEGGEGVQMLDQDAFHDGDMNMADREAEGDVVSISQIPHPKPHDDEMAAE